MTMQNISEST